MAKRYLTSIVIIESLDMNLWAITYSTMADNISGLCLVALFYAFITHWHLCL